MNFFCSSSILISINIDAIIIIIIFKMIIEEFIHKHLYIISYILYLKKKINIFVFFIISLQKKKIKYKNNYKINLSFFSFKIIIIAKSSYFLFFFFCFVWVFDATNLNEMNDLHTVYQYIYRKQHNQHKNI